MSSDNLRLLGLTLPEYVLDIFADLLYLFCVSGHKKPAFRNKKLCGNN